MAFETLSLLPCLLIVSTSSVYWHFLSCLIHPCPWELLPRFMVSKVKMQATHMSCKLLLASVTKPSSSMVTDTVVDDMLDMSMVMGMRDAPMAHAGATKSMCTNHVGTLDVLRGMSWLAVSLFSGHF